MPLQTLEPQRLYRQIAGQLRTLIGKGEYKAGARLPAERDLARQMGVSRPSVREALIALEVGGLVEVRIGSGVYVLERPPAPAPVAALPEDSGPFELIAARSLVESECAALAAKHATRTQVRAIEEALDHMAAEHERGVMPLGADREFHLRIAEASGNSALGLVVRTLWEQRTGPLFRRLEHHYDTPTLWQVALREHRQIVAAIARHDTAGARSAMRRHMNQSAKRFSASWDQGEKAWKKKSTS